MTSSSSNITKLVKITSSLSPYDTLACTKFDDAKTQVLNLRDKIIEMDIYELLLFIPDESFEIKEAYTYACRILLTDTQNPNFHTVSPDSWLSYAMLVMMDGIIWENNPTLEYDLIFYQIRWLMNGVFKLNSYARRLDEFGLNIDIRRNV